MESQQKNFGSQEVQKMNMKMEIRKRKMGMIQKETFWEKLFYEVENKYACLTWEAPRKFPAEQKTDQQTVQRAEFLSELNFTH